MTTAGRHSRLPRESESGTDRPAPVDQPSGFTDPVQVSRDDARLALHKVLNSPEFSSVIQLRSFLNYVVSKAIEDRLDEIKGYTIAVEALGRDASFNPVTDPIVRVEAARLRRRLSKYYAGSGKHDPIVIAIPKGSYVPVFELRKNGIVSAKASSGTTREQQGRPCEDQNPGQRPRIAGQILPYTDSPAADTPPETTLSEIPAGTDPAENPSATSAGAGAVLGNMPNKIRLPAAICILFLAFIAGFVLGTAL
jgi:hypothetical protein